MDTAACLSLHAVRLQFVFITAKKTLSAFHAVDEVL